ncbi:YdaS family helix-turn-helix protein [Ramlibacter sp. Leaf400]|uniref:YdaS family helix-turn-helix protein n=1 Tax=Ramlibacter sp. Leaf400 TaxID=1736365 RepID=UPI002E12DFA8
MDHPLRSRAALICSWIDCMDASFSCVSLLNNARCSSITRRSCGAQMDLRPTSLVNPAAKAIRLLGGPVRAAASIGVERYQTVQSWVRNRVPAEYCPLIERATDGAVRCEELRPDVAWDVLRAKAAANDAPHETPSSTAAAGQGAHRDTGERRRITDGEPRVAVEG